MLNVFKAITKMRNFQTQAINSINEIDDVINKTMSPKKDMKIQEQVSNLELDEQSIIVEKKCHDESDLEEMRVFMEIRKQFKLFDYVASGDPQHIEYMLGVFNNDPEHKSQNPDKHKMIVNKLDNNGKSLLYIASIYGHINIVKLLIQKGADVYYRCKVTII